MLAFRLNLNLALKGKWTLHRNPYWHRLHVNNRQFTSNTCKQTVCNMPTTALVLIANGTEELECITVVNILRRGAVEVTLAGLNGYGPVLCRSQSKICPDTSICEVLENSFDVIVLPGGMEGTKAFAESEEVGALLKRQEENNGYIAAICAAPTALKEHNICTGRNITSYPALADQLRDQYRYKDNVPVVVDENLITSRGPATSYIFGLTILEKLQGREKAKEVANAMLYIYE